MVFSSIIFLFAFLPITIFGYYVVFKKNKKRQNHFLLFCSLFFYACGGVKYLLLMLLSIVMNWLFARLIDRSIANKFRKAILATAFTFNISLLFVYKYLAFSIRNINTLFNLHLRIPNIVLPIGISFFTFQAMSYVIDVYRKNGKALTNVLDVGLYISLFPQLIAGPIVRYTDIKDQLFNRVETYDRFAEGTYSFVIGLSKKAILADTLAIVAKTSFEANNRAVLTAWIGIIAYTLQIYFDFSGYSDMAIGLGRMFGFEFIKNFDYPYLSNSVTEFWRRWHISMGSWFRDYVYIPLGGSRVDSRLRYYYNLFIVWLLTGLWHGANWTFVLWGLLHLFALIIEKSFKLNEKIKTNRLISVGMRIYTLLFVIIGWVFFNSPSVHSGFNYVISMFDFSSSAIDANTVFCITQYGIALIVGIICCFPIRKLIDNKCPKSIKWIILFLLFAVSIIYIAKGSYSPFIYFNF